MTLFAAMLTVINDLSDIVAGVEVLHTTATDFSDLTSAELDSAEKSLSALLDFWRRAHRETTDPAMKRLADMTIDTITEYREAVWTERLEKDAAPETE